MLLFAFLNVERQVLLESRPRIQCTGTCDGRRRDVTSRVAGGICLASSLISLVMEVHLSPPGLTDTQANLEDPLRR
jgi:hypothetical protein